jgi:hypothetical protein
MPGHILLVLGQHQECGESLRALSGSAHSLFPTLALGEAEPGGTWVGEWVLGRDLGFLKS